MKNEYTIKIVEAVNKKNKRLTNRQFYDMIARNFVNPEAMSRSDEMSVIRWRSGKARPTGDALLSYYNIWIKR